MVTGATWHSGGSQPKRVDSSPLFNVVCYSMVYVMLSSVLCIPGPQKYVR